VFVSVPYFVRLPGAWVEEQGPVIVVAHSCEYTKATRQRERPLSIAPLLQTDELPGGQPGDARAGRMSRYWPLPEVPPLEAGFVADFANIQPLVAEDLEHAERVTSIDDDGQVALVGRLWIFYAQRAFQGGGG
jgi:hypothetical protein